MYWTKAQADAYLRARPMFLETDIQTCAEPIRAKLDGGEAVTSQERETLSRFYFNFRCIAGHASKELFQNIAVDQLELWIKHVADVLKKLTTDSGFIQTGILPEHDEQMLGAMVVFAIHSSVVVRMDQAKFLHVLGDFGAACAAPRMLSPGVAQSICWFCNNFYSASLGDNKWTVREIFKKLERSGLLGQTIRCATVPPKDTSEKSGYEEFFDVVLENCIYICKSFQKGRKTGDMLSAVLDGRDGYTGERNPEIDCRLTNLSRFCDYANPVDKTDCESACRKCNTHGNCQLCTGCDCTFLWEPANVLQTRLDNEFLISRLHLPIFYFSCVVLFQGTFYLLQSLNHSDFLVFSLLV